MKIYHNPNCSKSCSVLGMLKGREIEVREYLTFPLDEIEVAHLAAKLCMRPYDLLRKNEPRFRELNLNPDDDAAVICALAKYPELLERPIVEIPLAAMIARPPEKLADFFARAQFINQENALEMVLESALEIELVSRGSQIASCGS